MQRLNCSTLSFSACLGSFTSDRNRILRKPLLKSEKWSVFIYSHFQLTVKVGLSIQLNCRPSIKKGLVFRLVVCAATVSMPCVHIRHLKLYVGRKFSTYFLLGGEDTFDLLSVQGLKYFALINACQSCLFVFDNVS